LIEEEHDANSSGLKSSEEDRDDFYEDFVIVEKVDLEKHNQPEKLHEEQKLKDKGTS